MNNFKYSAKKINEMIEKNGCQKVTMNGICNDLEKLKPIIEKIYNENIFYLSYWKSECGFFGWEWDKDDGEMASMWKITEGISEKFLEIYALILAGLGERMEED